MKILNLPDDIFSENKAPGSDIIIYHYTSDKDSLKEKSVLNRNAFSLVISGYKTMHFAEKTINVQDSEIHLLSAGNCIASVNISNQKPFESILIFFSSGILNEFYISQSKLIEKLKKENSKPSAYLEFKKDEFINNFIQSLLLVIKKSKMLSEPMKKLKLQELLLYLLENYPDSFLSFGNTRELSDIELRVRKAVETNRENNLTIDELAFLCNISPSTFKRQFKKIYNSSPNAWLNEQRMIIAGKMLREQNAKPGEIWDKLGFETHTGFTKSFKKHFGRTPKEYTTKLTYQE